MNPPGSSLLPGFAIRAAARRAAAPDILVVVARSFRCSVFGGATELLCSQPLARAVQDGKDQNLIAPNDEEDPVDAPSSTVEELANFLVKRFVFWCYRAAPGAFRES